MVLGAARAQQPARVDIQAPSNRVIVGEGVDFAAVARDGAGNILPNAVISWSVTSPSGATNPMVLVSPQGRVTGRVPGTAMVFAQSGNARTGIALTVLPLRIDLEPAQAEIAVGEQLQLKGIAVDVNGQPFNWPTFNWEVTGANGGQINAASIDRDGVLTGRAVGRITVRAVMQFPSPQVGRVWGTSVVTIRTRRDYRLRRLLATDDVRHSFSLRPIQLSSIAVNDAGQVAFVGSLDGLLSGLLLYEQGSIRMLAGGGQPDVSSNNGFGFGLRDTPAPPSINNRGDVLTTFWIHPGGQALALATQTGLRYLLFQGQSLGEFESLNGFQIRPQSLNDNGEALFQAGFRRASTGQGANGLFRVSGRSVEIIHTTDTPLPGLGLGYAYNWFGQDNDGVVYFIASGPSGGALFRRQGFAAPERLIGSGDQLAGGRVTWFSFSAAVGRRGGVAIGVGVDDRGTLVWFRGSQRDVGTLGPGNIYWAEPSQGVLLTAFGPQGNGLYRYFDGRYTPVLIQGRLAPNEEPIQSIDGAGLTARGDAIVQVSTSDHRFAVIQPGAANPMLVQDGTRVDVTAAPHFPCCGNSVLRGGGPVQVQLGNPRSIWEIAGRTLIPVILLGDRLPGGAWLGNSSFLSNSDGDILVQSSGSLYRRRSGQFDLIAANNGPTEDGRRFSNNIQPLSISDNGTVTFYGNAYGDDRIYLWRDGRLTRLLSMSSSPAFVAGIPTDSWAVRASVDDNGRVLALLNRQGRFTGAAVFQDGSWQPAMVPLSTRITGQTVRDFNPVVRGGRIFALFNFQVCCDNVLTEMDGGEWIPRIASGASMPNGATMQNLGGGFDANRQGDIVFYGQTPGRTTICVRSGDTTRIVYAIGDPTGQGDTLANVNELQIRDDGTVIFGGFDVTGRYVLYAADPL